MPKKNENLHTYTYDGPVRIFDDIFTAHWKGKTQAPSEAKARSNLAFQFKREYGKSPATKVTLTGKINLIN